MTARFSVLTIGLILGSAALTTNTWARGSHAARSGATSTVLRPSATHLVHKVATDTGTAVSRSNRTELLTDHGMHLADHRKTGDPQGSDHDHTHHPKPANTATSTDASTSVTIAAAPALPTIAPPQVPAPASSATDQPASVPSPALSSATSTGGTAAPDSTGGGGATLADCMTFWGPETHMTKVEWRATCVRSLEGLDLLGGAHEASAAGQPSQSDHVRHLTRRAASKSSHTGL